ncbi:hypothetical protein IFM47457_10523 [Aspergillus lentulus]|nr:hypothetical protein IFM47457_10523 [Aspergillus lentulus]
MALLCPFGARVRKSASKWTGLNFFLLNAKQKVSGADDPSTLWRKGAIARDTFEIAFAVHQIVVPTGHEKPLAKD